MKILIIAQYFVPEEVGIGVQLHQLATDLVARGHHVTMLTAFPNYPKGRVFKGYQGMAFMRERIDGVEVIRTFIYTSPSQSIRSKALNFASFCASSIFGGIAGPGPDVIYCVMPPLPLGVSAQLIGLIKRAPVVVNVQDIYPDIAIQLGVLRNARLIRFFRAMEKAIYSRAAGVTVISQGFKENILGKGVPASKVHLVPNWADPDAVRPGPKDNTFRQGLEVDGRFALVYSGSLSHNSNLDPVIEAAAILRNEPFAFAIVGEGVRKPELERRARELQLENVRFLPFQPLESYPLVLAAADMNLVTLNTQAALASVPSKVLKMMASGRPVLAITSEGNELHRLVTDGACGLHVPPDNPAALADALRYGASHPLELEAMGNSGRRSFEKHFSRQERVAQIEEILKSVVRG